MKIAKHAQLYPIIIFVNYMYYTRLKLVRGIRGFCAQTVRLSRPLFVKKLTEKQSMATNCYSVFAPVAGCPIVLAT